MNNETALVHRFPFIAKLVYAYVAIMFLVLITSAFFHFNSMFRKNYTYQLFSLDKSVVKVQAKVLGYGYSAAGGRRSSTTFSYQYGFTYSLNNQPFYGVARSIISVDGHYDSYTPIPKLIEIYVDKYNPKNFTHSPKHYGIHSVINFLVFLYIILLCIAPFALKGVQKIEFKQFKDYVALLGGALFIVAPVYLTIKVNANLHKGSTAENIHGFELIHKNSKQFHDIHRESPRINMSIHNRNSEDRQYQLSGISDQKIHKMYVHSESGAPYPIDFKYKNDDIYIDEPKGFSILGKVVYAISDNGRYAIPLDILQYDFDYQVN